MGKIIAIVGQMASGKSSLASYLRAAGYEQIREYTTRPQRDTETADTLQHIHVPDAEFTSMLDSGQFAAFMEYQTVFGLWRYGITKASLQGQRDLVLATNPVHVQQLKESGYGITVVFLDLPQEVIMRRALARGDSPAEIGRRITDDKRRFDNLLMSGAVDLHITDPDLSTADIAAKILKFPS